MLGRIQQVTSLVLWFITFQIAPSFSAQDAFVGTSTSFDQSIDIPAASSLSKRYFSLFDAVIKGNLLLCRLENPNLLNDQSRVISIDMLATSGWVSAIEPVDPNIDIILKNYFLQEGIEIDGDDMVAVRWRHDETSWNSDAEHVPPTGGKYLNVYNAYTGIIIAYNNFGPAYMVRARPIKTLPDIRAWSDITFVEWQRQAQEEGQDVSGLRYVIRYDIVNSDTADIIREIVGESTNILWPGITISMSTDEGRAILGTPNGAGVAFLLATHKVQLGQKTVESVKLWARRVRRGTRAPASSHLFAVFKIGPVASSSSEPSTSM